MDPPRFTSTSTSTQDLGSQRTMTSTGVGSGQARIRTCSRFVSTWDDDKDFEFDHPPNFKLGGDKNVENDDDEEVEATDNLLGRLRRGMNIIETHARETMAECPSAESSLDMEERLEKSTLRMLKAEKSFVNTARIIAGVVDDFAGEYETPDDAKKSSEPHENSEDHVILFRDDMLKSSSIAPFRERMNQIFDERMTSFQDGLTDDVLKVDKRFKNLQRQIRYGKKDAERSKCTDALDDLPGGGGDVPDFQNFEEFQDDRRTAESEEDDDYDDAILPTMDPLSREPIKTAVTNKFCHHVYDLESITGLIRDNSEAKCPVEGCKNEVALKFADLIVQPKLTEQIRTKNDKLYGRSYNHTHLINHLISL